MPAIVKKVWRSVRSGSLARDRDDLTREVAGVVAGKERDGRRDLPRLGGSAEGLAFG